MNEEEITQKREYKKRYLGGRIGGCGGGGGGGGGAAAAASGRRVRMDVEAEKENVLRGRDVVSYVNKIIMASFRNRNQNGVVDSACSSVLALQYSTLDIRILI
ncbi:Hypothetical predicted protein [Octopus vulgaris]|uniref:Uncharacterized protein n=1 Tax=Octopus vulgaris TaxID=6645 RepID=A0AA36AT10_OCTVU|nr:Hypothetical predicted protein [Octopus vulgaris]